MATTVRGSIRLTLVAVLALSGCTGKPTASTTPPASAPTTVPSAPSGASASAPTEQAVAAYLNLLHAFVAASNSGSTDTREMAKYATGSALDLLAQGLTDNKKQGVKTAGQPGVSQPKVVKADPTANPIKVDVTGCVDDTNWKFYKYDGKPADNTPSGRRATNAEITNVGGTWRVTLLAIRGVGTCTG
jgi:hypothetical protein